MALPMRDRREGGRLLAAKLAAYAGEPDVLVLGLPRGGVPVAFEVAIALGAPLDVVLVRKLGVPGHEELAMGAIASGGARVLNEDVVAGLGIPEDVVDAVADRERRELERRERLYRGDRLPPEVRGRTVVLVDDGLATGATMRVAAAALRAQHPRRLVVAVPIASPATCAEVRAGVDQVVCAHTAEPFYAVGLWYEDFSPTTDEEVRDVLRTATQRSATARAGGRGRHQAADRPPREAKRHLAPPAPGQAGRLADRGRREAGRGEPSEPAQRPRTGQGGNEQRVRDVAGRTRHRDLLARHGIAPDADEATLLAALAARGWEARVEELATRPEGGSGRAPRYRALALRTRPPEEVTDRPGHHVAHRHLQAGGRTAEVALGKLLAAVLEREG